MPKMSNPPVSPCENAWRAWTGCPTTRFPSLAEDPPQAWMGGD
jgi:hypothetical protein